jgi:hypothetical protein
VPTLGLVVALTALAGCGGVDVVDAGAYEGVVDEAKPGEKEIYVVLDDGRKLELYFTDETVLEQAGEPVAFAKLEAGSRVRVTVTRDGNRNVPTRVEILS